MFAWQRRRIEQEILDAALFDERQPLIGYLIELAESQTHGQSFLATVLLLGHGQTLPAPGGGSRGRSPSGPEHHPRRLPDRGEALFPMGQSSWFSRIHRMTARHFRIQSGTVRRSRLLKDLARNVPLASEYVEQRGVS